MTSINAESVILKTDRQGRVRTPLAQREALLDAFECSGLSGIKFAALHGVKYPSFANWVQQRKRHRSISAAAAGPECGAGEVAGAGGSSLRGGKWSSTAARPGQHSARETRGHCASRDAHQQ